MMTAGQKRKEAHVHVVTAAAGVSRPGCSTMFSSHIRSHAAAPHLTHWRPVGEKRSWPAVSTPFNLALRLSAGLGAVYEEICISRKKEPQQATHETLSNGSLRLTETSPLLARRYRYLHTISDSALSQVVCAVDTYRMSRSHGNSQLILVAIKIMNAQHWALGAQEFERSRLLWRGLSRQGCLPRISRPRAHFEVQAHFCIVFDYLLPIAVLEKPQPQCTLVHETKRGCTEEARSSVTQVRGAIEARVCHCCDSTRPRRVRLELDALRVVAAQLLGSLAALDLQVKKPSLNSLLRP